jgi:hypothetical protein
VACHALLDSPGAPKTCEKSAQIDERARCVFLRGCEEWPSFLLRSFCQLIRKEEGEEADSRWRLVMGDVVRLEQR